METYRAGLCCTDEIGEVTWLVPAFGTRDSNRSFRFAVGDKVHGQLRLGRIMRMCRRAGIDKSRM